MPSLDVTARPREGRRRLSSRLRTVSRFAAAAVVWAAAVLPAGAFAPAYTSSAQVETGQVGGGVGGGIDFGFGTTSPYGLVSTSDSWSFVHSPLALNSVDPYSGAMIQGDAVNPGGFSLSATTALLETQNLAFDAARLAAQAKAIQEAQRKAAGSSGGVAVKRSSGYGYPEDWELSNFSKCGHPNNATFQARTEVVLAFEELCQAAKADGVNLRISSAYRSVEHQRRLWNQKLRETGGNEAEARKWVAPPGRSNHNRGIAIDLSIISGDPKSKAWVHKPVGCYRPPETVRIGPYKCGSGEDVIKQVQLYGFILPMTWEPWHIELGIRVDTGDAPGAKTAANCSPDRAMSVPEMIGAIWRCRLRGKGYGSAEIEKIVQEALVVARCESEWNPSAFIYGGRYAYTPHPKYGRVFTARGVFQFLRASGDTWIEGGWANAEDPVANIDAAARYYIWEREKGREGWGPWECRTRLPQYGGPPIPDYAKKY